MADLLHIFGGPLKAAEIRPEPPERQLLDAIADAGLTPPEAVTIDGKLRRFSTNGKTGDDSGWYVAFPGSIPAGQFGDWRSGLAVPWRADIGRELTVVETMALARQTAEAKRLRDAERDRRRESAADTAAAIWEAATPASGEHPYLASKSVLPHGLRVTGDGRLVCPIYRPDGELASLQFIAPDGEKRFLSGGGVGGGTLVLGSPIGARHCYVAEGYATAASIYEATGQPVVVAYSAGNMTAAAQAAAAHGLPVTVVADNDTSGTGQREGQRAAEAIGARLIIPPVDGGDANDYAQSGGDLAALLAPPEPAGWLVPADDFSREPSPIRWLVKGWLPREGLAMMHGPSGGGKTFAALDWVCRIAAGLEDWAGHRVRGGPVVYLAGEGHHGLRGRIAAWRQYHQVDHLDLWISSSGTDLNTPDGYAFARQAISGLPCQPVLIVVDTLHRHLRGDENSAQDSKTMIDACAALQREYRAAALLIHHTGNADEAQHRARGSSAWRGALETEISVVPGTDGEPLELVHRKSKDSELAQSVYLSITPVELPWIDEDGEPVTSAVVLQAEPPAISAGSETRAEGNARQFFEAAALKYGDRSSESGVFISAESLREYALTHGDWTTDSVRRKGVSQYKKRLLEAGKIVEHQDGYMITDTAMCMILRLGK